MAFFKMDAEWISMETAAANPWSSTTEQIGESVLGGRGDRSLLGREA
jgi:hypothetical protein